MIDLVIHLWGGIRRKINDPGQNMTQETDDAGDGNTQPGPCRKPSQNAQGDIWESIIKQDLEDGV